MTHVRQSVQRFAVLTAAMTLFLILAGGFVTTTRTGDTIPGWPWLWGRITAGFWIEWTHRALAIVVGLLVTVLAILTRHRLAWIALVAVCIQAALGGLRVLTESAGGAIAIVHAVFAQVIFGAMVVLAFGGRARVGRDGADARTVGIAATATAFLQLVAGAVTRHTGVGLPLHLIGAVAVTVVVGLFASHLLQSSLRRGGVVLLGLLGFQLALGFTAWLITSGGGFERSHLGPVVPIILVTSHVAGGALVLATTFLLTLECGRADRSAARLEGASA